MKNKQFISLALAFCLIFALCIPASAAVNVPNGMFSSNYFSSYGVVLGDAGSHQLRITFSTDGMGICDELGVSNFSVDKKITGDDGSTYWANVGTFSGQTGHNVGSNVPGSGDVYVYQDNQWCCWNRTQNHHYRREEN